MKIYSLRLLTIVLAFCAPVLALAGTIRGRVRLADNTPVDNIVIRLRGENVAFQDETQTDRQGKFIFENLPLNTFSLSIEGQGFRPYVSHIDISTSRMSFEDITLRPAKDPEPIIPPEGPKAQISAQEAAMPTAARQEYAKAQQLFLQEKKPHESIPHFLRSLDQYTSNPDVFILLAMAYMQDGDPKSAVSTLQKNVESNPQSADAHITLGVLLNQSKDYAGAEKVLLHGIELDAGIPQGHYELAKTYWATGRWQDAEPRAQKAVELMPNLAAAHVILGNIAYVKKHDPQVALKEFQEYLRLDPSGPMAQGTQQMIAKIEQELKKAK